MSANLILLPHATGELGSWVPLFVLLGLFFSATLLLAAFGRPQVHRSRLGAFLLRIPDALERVTSVPGWAVATVATALLGLLIAGIGFYNDVSWHVDLGRDEVLFTAPHTMIVAGLTLIAASSFFGILFASLAGLDTQIRWRGVRVPWSSLVLGVLGASALSGFPLDELWHRQYGIDVTMWSPTHMLMICGASLTPLGAWLALSEAGVGRDANAWGKGLRIAAAWLVLGGLASIQGEFEFGVPQFQLLYLPVLISLAAGIGLVAARIVLGPGRTLLIVALSFFLRFSDVAGASGDGHVRPRTAAVFVGSAIAVELAGLLFGTERRLRFAIAAGAGIATLGFGVEWLWNSELIFVGAHQPWTPALVRDALLVGGVVALGASVIGAAYGSAVSREPGRPRAMVVALAGLVVLAGLLWPLPRRTGEVVAHVTPTVAGDLAVVEVRLDPPDAARDARWFQTIAWQGGGLVLADMVPSGEGVYRTERPVPVGGTWKTMVRLHRGAEMMSVPVFMPDDPEIDAAEIPAVERTQAFESEQRYLLREVRPGPPWFAITAYLIIGLIAAGWVTSFAAACARIGRRPPVGVQLPGRPLAGSRRQRTSTRAGTGA